MKEDSEWRERMGQSWLEYVAAEPEATVLWLDQARRDFLREGDLCGATRASIFLVVLLAWAGLEEEIQMVIDELRHAVRGGGRPARWCSLFITSPMQRRVESIWKTPPWRRWSGCGAASRPWEQQITFPVPMTAPDRPKGEAV